MLDQCRPGRRHELAEDQGLQLFADPLEAGNGREHCIQDGHERHHREQRGVGQGGCRLESVMRIETLNQFTQAAQDDGQPAAVKELWASHVAL